MSNAHFNCELGQLDETVTSARVSLQDVPQTDEGIRIYAANGNWSDVLTLADKLEDRASSMSLQYPERYPISLVDRVDTTLHAKGSSSGVASDGTDVSRPTASSATPFVSPQTVSLAARLPYVLVQVTANLKMRRIAAAKKIIDALGDVEDSAFLHPVTRESFVPFSLRVVAAFLPLYVGAPMEAQKKLYFLLCVCEEHEKRYSSALPVMCENEGMMDDGGVEAKKSSLSDTERQELHHCWLRRLMRVQRAILHVHIHVNQHSLGHSLLEKVIQTEDVFHRTFSVLSEDMYFIRQTLQLQQLFFFALYVGDEALAIDVKQRMSSGSGTTSVAPGECDRIFLRLILHQCSAFLMVFRKDFKAAAKEFETLALLATEAQAHHNALACQRKKKSVALPEGSISEDVLRALLLQDILVNSQLSCATCVPYSSDSDPSQMMGEMCGAMEKYGKENPHALYNSDAFVESLVRVYTLAGERAPKLEQLAGLLEIFRCDRESLPNLETLV